MQTNTVQQSYTMWYPFARLAQCAFTRATTNVILSAAKDLGLRRVRSFAALRITAGGRGDPRAVHFLSKATAAGALPNRACQILRCAQDDTRRPAARGTRRGTSPGVNASGACPRPGRSRKKNDGQPGKLTSSIVW